MKQETTTVRIPIFIKEIICNISDLKDWSNVTTLTKIIESSPLYVDYLTILEKNKETA